MIAARVLLRGRGCAGSWARASSLPAAAGFTSAPHMPKLEHLKFQWDDEIEGLGTITLSRPQARDALSPEMANSMVALSAYLNRLQPSQLRCVLLRSSTDKAFSAGRDLKASSAGAQSAAVSHTELLALQQQQHFINTTLHQVQLRLNTVCLHYVAVVAQISATHTTEEQKRAYLLNCVDSAMAVHKLRAPTIAVLTGAAFGWGVEVALACDVRVAADEATLCLPECGLGELRCTKFCACCCAWASRVRGSTRCRRILPSSAQRRQDWLHAL
jgi:enoyl-CoA hydratase/carnithine racemase